MTNQNPDSRREREILFSYLTGFITAALVLIAVVAFLSYKMGFAHIWNRLEASLFGRTAETVMFLPDDVRKELTALRAVIGNAGNPTEQTKHDTILVHPDPIVGYRLNPETRIYVNMLRSTASLNFDPPNLNMDRPVEDSSEKLQQYVADQSRLSYSYGIDEHGRRITLPSVDSDREILMIGDSVLFGQGVDDAATVASHLQKEVGDNFRIINAGVGGYSGQQAFLLADELSREKEYSALVYVACQNDFLREDDVLKEAKDVLGKLKTISERFGNRIIVMFQTYMEYNMRDIFLDEGWSKKKIDETELLREELPELTKALGFEYFDWSEIVDDYMMENKSIFSRFALYVDHVHLSPLGNSLMAEHLSTSFRQESQ